MKKVHEYLIKVRLELWFDENHDKHRVLDTMFVYTAKDEDVALDMMYDEIDEYYDKEDLLKKVLIKEIVRLV